MYLVKPYARLMQPAAFGTDPGSSLPFTEEDGKALLMRSEFCARISHRSEERQDGYTHTERFLRDIVLKHGDWSVTEHCVISADLEVDRGLSHELVRHRIAAYTQESTRFCNYGKEAQKGIGVVLPPELECAYDWTHSLEPISLAQIEEYNPANSQAELDQNYKTRQHWNSWLRGVKAAEEEYLFQVNTLKVAPEIARDMLPHCLAVRMIATHNLRGWRHIMLMRTTAETHRKLRPLMGSLLDELKVKVPVLYEDIDIGSRQAENLRKGR